MRWLYEWAVRSNPHHKVGVVVLRARPEASQHVLRVAVPRKMRNPYAFKGADEFEIACGNGDHGVKAGTAGAEIDMLDGGEAAEGFQDLLRKPCAPQSGLDYGDGSHARAMASS